MTDFQIVLLDYANMIVLAGVMALALWLLLANIGMAQLSDSALQKLINKINKLPPEQRQQVQDAICGETETNLKRRNNNGKYTEYQQGALEGFAFALEIHKVGLELIAVVFNAQRLIHEAAQQITLNHSTPKSVIRDYIHDRTNEFNNLTTELMGKQQALVSKQDDSSLEPVKELISYMATMHAAFLKFDAIDKRSEAGKKAEEKALNEIKEGLKDYPSIELDSLHALYDKVSTGGNPQDKIIDSLCKEAHDYYKNKKATTYAGLFRLLQRDYKDKKGQKAGQMSVWTTRNFRQAYKYRYGSIRKDG